MTGAVNVIDDTETQVLSTLKRRAPLKLPHPVHKSKPADAVYAPLVPDTISLKHGEAGTEDVKRGQAYKRGLKK